MFVNGFIDKKYHRNVVVTPEEAMNYVNALNDNTSIVVHIIKSIVRPAEYLTIGAGNKTRRIVIASNLLNSDGTPVKGQLIDPSVIGYDETVKFLEEDLRNRTPWALRQTVSIETATRVAQYFVEHECVPNDTIWEMPVAAKWDYTEEEVSEDSAVTDTIMAAAFSQISETAAM